MLSCLKSISQGCFEIQFTLAWIAVILWAYQGIKQHRFEPHMSIFIFLFISMILWRMLLRIFAFRYAIGLTIPAAVLTAFLPQFVEWPFEWLRRTFNWLLVFGMVVLTTGMLIRVVSVPTEQNDFDYFGKKFKSICVDSKQLAILDTGKHGMRIAYALKLPYQPYYYHYSLLESFSSELEKCLETADYILITTTDKDVETLRRILEKYQIPMETINAGRHWGFLLDNRKAYHWGQHWNRKERSNKGDVFSLDFENPEYLKITSGDTLNWFREKGYRFAANETFFFVPQLQLIKHGDLKEENIGTSELKLLWKQNGDDVLAGQYSCYVRTTEYFTFNITPLKSEGMYRFGIDFQGKFGSRLIFQALLVNPNGVFETHRLGSFKILEENQPLHGEFITDVSHYQSRDKEFTLQLVVSGDLEFDNLNVFRK